MLSKKRLNAPNNSTHTHKPPHICSLALAVSLAFSGISPNVEAQTFTVINNHNLGLGSLRTTILEANNTAGDDTIVFHPSLAHSTITLLSGEILINSLTGSDSLTIVGPLDGKANSIVIDAGQTSRIFNVLPSTGTLTLENMTLTGGYVSPIIGYTSGTNGAAIQTDNTDLVINNSVLTGNNTSDFSNSGLSDGGAIHSHLATTTINQTVISGNTAHTGGGIHANRAVTLNESVLIDNYSYLGGGGIDISTGSLTLNQSTISSNTIGSGGNKAGAGVRSIGTDIILNQSTISENKCLHLIGCEGAAIHARFGDITLNQSTVTDNSSTNGTGTGGIHLHLSDSASPSAELTLNNSILSGNTGVEGNLSYSFNLSGVGTAPIVNVIHSMFGDSLAETNGDTTGANFYNNPDLGPLQSNGGLTPTHRPNATSYVLGAGSNALVTDTNDQRGKGFQRIQGTTVDMGAVERQTIINGGLNEVIKRGEIARALLEKIGETPPLFATGLEYHDVQAIDPNANWIAHFKAEGYTDNGCDSNRFCADSIVSREEMAKIFAKVLNGSGFIPQQTQEVFFDDVNSPQSFNIDWINYLHKNGYTSGCDGDNFCPKAPVTREWFEFLLNQIP